MSDNIVEIDNLSFAYNSRLLHKGIKICSLNQKNVLVDPILETGQTKYIIIDVSEDFFPPLSPLYNGLTIQLCT